MALDLIPTLADMLSLEVGWTVDGHPAGSPDISDRGETKPFLEVTPLIFGAEIQGTVEFEATDERPVASDRWIDQLVAGEEPIAGLLRQLGRPELIGVPVDDFRVDAAVTGTLTTDDDLAGSSLPATALVAGRVDSEAEGDLFVAVDGVVVTGSRLFDQRDGSAAFATLLPMSLLGTSAEPELFLYTDRGDALRVEIAG